MRFSSFSVRALWRTEIVTEVLKCRWSVVKAIFSCLASFRMEAPSHTRDSAVEKFAERCCFVVDDVIDWKEKMLPLESRF